MVPIDHPATAVREHVLDLPGRGRLPVWEWAGPAGAPVLLLLHGATLDAEVNWFAVGPALSARFRVLAFDLRGHGRGLPAVHPYRLADCADDAAAVVRALGAGPVVAVGYSMGGMVAQEFWHRHPDLTAGLVLCATARNVTGTLWERSVALGMPLAVAMTRWWPPFLPLGSDTVAGALLDADLAPAQRIRVLARMRRTPLSVALDAMTAVSAFTSHLWISAVDVPTSVLVTRRDRVVPPRRQHKLADAVHGSTVVEIDGDHGVFCADVEAFTDALLQACAAATFGRPPTENTAA